MKYLIGIIALALVAVGAWNYIEKEEVNEETENIKTEVTAPTVSEASEVDELEEYQVADIDYVDATKLINNQTNSMLTQTEIDGLAFMREEEKLARDVYLTLYDVWGVQIFSNIAGSEVTHMDAILTLLERYDIQDPASTERGVFTNPDLQTLYNELVAKGEQSLAAAFRVGAKIEDLDIRDLEENLAATDNPDIRIVYESLQRGSRNHLRAFNRQLLNETGSNYEPEFISQAEFDSIIAEGVERGGGQGGGSGQGQGARQGGQGGGQGGGRN